MSKDEKEPSWLDRAYAECTKLGHHNTGSKDFHNGACQEGYAATAPDYKKSSQ